MATGAGTTRSSMPQPSILDWLFGKSKKETPSSSQQIAKPTPPKQMPAPMTDVGLFNTLGKTESHLFRQTTITSQIELTKQTIQTKQINADFLFKELNDKLQKPVLEDNVSETDIHFINNIFQSLGKINKDEITKFIDNIYSTYLEINNADNNSLIERKINAYDYIITFLFKNEPECLKIDSFIKSIEKLICKLNANLVSLNVHFDFDVYAMYRLANSDIRDFYLHKNNIKYIISNQELRTNLIYEFGSTPPKNILTPEKYVMIYKNIHDVLYEEYKQKDTQLKDNFVLANLAHFSVTSLLNMYFHNEPYFLSNFIRKKISNVIKFKLLHILCQVDDYTSPRLKTLEQSNKEIEKAAFKRLEEMKLTPATPQVLDDILFDVNFILEFFQKDAFSSQEILETILNEDKEKPIGVFLYENTFGVESVLCVNDINKVGNDSIYTDFTIYAVNSTLDKLPVSYLSIESSYIPAYLKSIIKSVSTVAESMVPPIFNFLTDPKMMNGFGVKEDTADILGKLGLREILFATIMNPYDRNVIPQKIKLDALGIFNDVEFSPIYNYFKEFIFSHSEAEYLLIPKDVHLYYTEDSCFDYKKLADNKEYHQYVLFFNKEKNDFVFTLIGLSGYRIELDLSDMTNKHEVGNYIKGLMESSEKPYLYILENEFHRFFPRKITPEILARNIDLCRILFDELLRKCIFETNEIFSTLPESQQKNDLINLIELIGKAYQSQAEDKLKNLLYNKYQFPAIYYILAISFLSLSSDKGLGIHFQKMVEDPLDNTKKIRKDVLNDSINAIRFIGVYFLTLFIETISLPPDAIMDENHQMLLDTCKMYIIQSITNTCVASMVGNFETLLNDVRKNKLFLTLRMLRIERNFAELDILIGECASNISRLANLGVRGPDAKKQLDKLSSDLHTFRYKRAILSKEFHYLKNTNGFFTPFGLVRNSLLFKPSGKNGGAKKQVVDYDKLLAEEKKLFAETEKRWDDRPRNYPEVF